jgi:hypothetical protein
MSRKSRATSGSRAVMFSEGHVCRDRPPHVRAACGPRQPQASAANRTGPQREGTPTALKPSSAGCNFLSGAPCTLSVGLAIGQPRALLERNLISYGMVRSARANIALAYLLTMRVFLWSVPQAVGRQHHEPDPKDGLTATSWRGAQGVSLSKLHAAILAGCPHPPAFSSASCSSGPNFASGSSLPGLAATRLPAARGSPQPGRQRTCAFSIKSCLAHKCEAACGAQAASQRGGIRQDALRGAAAALRHLGDNCTESRGDLRVEGAGDADKGNANQGGD